MVNIYPAYKIRVLTNLCVIVHPDDDDQHKKTDCSCDVYCDYCNCCLVPMPPLHPSASTISCIWKNRDRVTLTLIFRSIFLLYWYNSNTDCKCTYCGCWKTYIIIIYMYSHIPKIQSFSMKLKKCQYSNEQWAYLLNEILYELWTLKISKELTKASI